MERNHGKDHLPGAGAIQQEAWRLEARLEARLVQHGVQHGSKQSTVPLRPTKSCGGPRGSQEGNGRWVKIAAKPTSGLRVVGWKFKSYMIWDHLEDSGKAALITRKMACQVLYPSDLDSMNEPERNTSHYPLRRVEFKLLQERCSKIAK